MNHPFPMPFSSRPLSGEQAPAHPQDWKHDISKLVESHRARRPQPAHPAVEQPQVRPDQVTAQDRAARIAAAVAARYANAPTYTEIFEQQEDEQAEFAADTGENASGPTGPMDGPAEMIVTATVPLQKEARNSVLAEALGSAALQPDAPSLPAQNSPGNPGTGAEKEFRLEPAPAPVKGARILLPKLPARPVEMDLHAPKTGPEPTLEEFLAASVVAPPIPLPANLIEFPREVVAPRRVRPQLAEGPLGPPRKSAVETAQMQLRIFEVGPENVPNEVKDEKMTGAGPAANVRPAPPPGPANRPGSSSAWSSIHLDAQPNQETPAETGPYGALPIPLQPASIDRRLMALAVDFCLVTGAFLAFLFVYALSTPHLPTGKAAMVTGTVVYLALWLLYQLLFFSLSNATVGMHYARIALCTFEDENPTRRQMQRRIAAWWVSALPLGLGLAWALLDEDSLSWHDRMTRTYQRIC